MTINMKKENLECFDSLCFPFIIYLYIYLSNVAPLSQGVAE